MISRSSSSSQSSQRKKSRRILSSKGRIFRLLRKILRSVFPVILFIPAVFFFAKGTCSSTPFPSSWRVLAFSPYPPSLLTSIKHPVIAEITTDKARFPSASSPALKGFPDPPFFLLHHHRANGNRLCHMASLVSTEHIQMLCRKIKARSMACADHPAILPLSILNQPVYIGILLRFYLLKCMNFCFPIDFSSLFIFPFVTYLHRNPP